METFTENPNWTDAEIDRSCGGQSKGYIYITEPSLTVHDKKSDRDRIPGGLLGNSLLEMFAQTRL